MKTILIKTLLLIFILSPIGVWAQEESELAKKSQNPVGNIISAPIEYWHHGGMTGGSNMNVYLAKPVYPVTFGNITLINRFIVPMGTVNNKAFDPNVKTSGLLNIQYQGFFTPANPGKVIFGLGPVIEFPTSTNNMGADKVSAGPALVVLAMPNKWVFGALFQNLWSFGSDEVKMLTFQYFINYNFDRGWYFTSTPILNANWNNEQGEQWTVPLGGGAGKMIRFGSLPVDFKLQVFSNVVTPTGGADWSMMFAMKFLFPKK